MNRIIMIARIGRIDGDELDVSQIQAVTRIEIPQRRRLRNRAFWESRRNAMLVDGDQRYVALIFQVAEPLAHFGDEQAAAPVLSDLDLDQLSGDRTVFISRSDNELVSRFFVDRHDTPAVPFGDAEHAENAIILAREFSNDLPFERVCLIAGRP